MRTDLPPWHFRPGPSGARRRPGSATWAVRNPSQPATSAGIPTSATLLDVAFNCGHGRRPPSNAKHDDAAPDELQQRIRVRPHRGPKTLVGDRPVRDLGLEPKLDNADSVVALHTWRRRPYAGARVSHMNPAWCLNRTGPRRHRSSLIADEGAAAPYLGIPGLRDWACRGSIVGTVSAWQARFSRHAHEDRTVADGHRRLPRTAGRRLRQWTRAIPGSRSRSVAVRGAVPSNYLAANAGAPHPAGRRSEPAIRTTSTHPSNPPAPPHSAIFRLLAAHRRSPTPVIPDVRRRGDHQQGEPRQWHGRRTRTS